MIIAREVVYRVELLDEAGGEMTVNVTHLTPWGYPFADLWRGLGDDAKDVLRENPDNADLIYDTMWIVSVTNLETGEIFQPADADQPEWPD